MAVALDYTVRSRLRALAAVDRAAPFRRRALISDSRDFALPRGVLSAYLDVFNILNANSNTLESDFSGPAFLTRVPLSVEAPRTARVGLQWTF